MLNLLLAFVLGAIAVLVILQLGGLILRALRVGRIMERRRLARYVARARAGDRQLEAGQLHSALAKFQAAFYPDPAQNQELAEAIRKHHTGLLTRLLAAADQVDTGGVRLMSLARADRLFQERDALQRRYFSARSSGRSLQETKRDFIANTNEVRSTLSELAAEITAAAEIPRTH